MVCDPAEGTELWGRHISSMLEGVWFARDLWWKWWKWWKCTKIQTFWKEIIEVIQEITGEHIQAEPWRCLFHKTDKSIVQYRRFLESHLLNTAKGLIPRYWWTSKIPSVKEWILKIGQICSFKEIIHAEEELVEKYNGTWGKWLDF